MEVPGTHTLITDLLCVTQRQLAKEWKVVGGVVVAAVAACGDQRRVSSFIPSTTPYHHIHFFLSTTYTIITNSISYIHSCVWEGCVCCLRFHSLLSYKRGTSA